MKGFRETHLLRNDQEIIPIIPLKRGLAPNFNKLG